jgi:hypothetical protein
MPALGIVTPASELGSTLPPLIPGRKGLDIIPGRKGSDVIMVRLLDGGGGFQLELE